MNDEPRMAFFCDANSPIFAIDKPLPGATISACASMMKRYKKITTGEDA
ncbi:hypothetical protein [Herbaspirillum autotrophicum]|nr:hypothetical protein [Herbaspirillum autotrophicum]